MSVQRRNPPNPEHYRRDRMSRALEWAADPGWHAEVTVVVVAGLLQDLAAGSFAPTVSQHNPVAARLRQSQRASQRATPRACSATPARRPSVTAAGAASGHPSSSATIAEGQRSSATPAPTSITAETTSRILIVQTYLMPGVWLASRVTLPGRGLVGAGDGRRPL